MGTLYIFVIIVTLSTHCSAYVVSHSETDTSVASVLLKEGQSAEILCMTKGTGDYFWRKGATLYNSTLVASFTVGEVSDDSQPYSVTANGTLHIRSVTLNDEGNYLCRVSSTENECYGEVKILVQASLLNFNLAIDRCVRESSCLLYLSPSQFTSLTCTALNAPPLMTLKWFNGSKEITEGIEKNEILHQNGNSREITSTVSSVYGHPASLTCQAVDPKRSNDDVRFAHAQVEMTVPAHETLPNWIIVSVTLAGCFIVFGIFLLIKATVKRKQRKKYTKLKTTEYKSLTTKVETKEEAINAKHLELTTFKASAESKDREISVLETDLKKKDIEIKGKIDDISKLTETIKDKDKMISVLREKDVENKSAMKSTLEIDKVKTTVSQAEINKKESELSFLKREVKNKDKEIFALQVDVKTKDQKISGLEEDVKAKDKIISGFEVDVKTKDEKISRLETSTKYKDKEISDKHKETVQLKVDVKTKDKKMSGLEEDLKAKDKTISGFETSTKFKDKEINDKQKEIVQLKVEVKTKDQKISGLEVDVKTKNQKISRLEEDVKAKDKAISGFEADLKK